MIMVLTRNHLLVSALELCAKDRKACSVVDNTDFFCWQISRFKDVQ